MPDRPFVTALADAQGADALGAVSVQTLRSVLREVAAPSLVVVMLAGGAGALGVERVGRWAAQFRTLTEAPLAVVETSSVLGEAGEREGAVAVSVAAFSQSSFGVTASLVRVPEEAAGAHDAVLASVARPREPKTKLWLGLVGPQAQSVAVLAAIEALAGTVPAVGGAVRCVVAAEAGMAPRPVDVALFSLETRLGVSVMVSSAFERLTDWMDVTRAEGSTLFTLGPRSCLEHLSALGESRPNAGPMLLAAEPFAGGGAPLVRTLLGVDPSRGSVKVVEAFAPGARVAFGVRNATVARAAMGQSLDALQRARRANAPAGVLLFTCAGRGSGFFGQRDVEVTAVRSRWKVATAGMQLGFELGPWGASGAKLHLFSAVVVLFDRPS